MSAFVDLQVNGYLGKDFSSPDLSVEDVLRVTSRLRLEGTGAYLAAVVTSAPETYGKVLPVLAAAMERKECAERLLGIHLEGPFISPRDGARGAHNAEFVRPPSIEFLQQMVEKARGRIRLLTVAPEMDGATELIEWAAAHGIVVGIGHTLAGAETIRRAVDAGAVFSTHLGNGLPRRIDRHENPLWPQLADHRLSAVLITDGYHVPPEFIRTVLSVKGTDRTIVTADSASIAGCEPGMYETSASRVELREGGGVWSLDAEGYLAGSDSNMLECMNHLASVADLEEEALWRLGRDNPARLLGLNPDAVPEAGVEYLDGRFVIGNIP